MPRFGFIPIVLTVALSSLCVAAQTQQPNPGAEKTETRTAGAITGRVVNENGQPLADVVVSANAPNSGAGKGTVTDRDGTFRVTDLEPNLSYYVNASLPAYTRPRPEPGAPPTPQTYKVGDSVTLTLIKGGVITGKVTNATGDPLVGIRVRAELILRARNGRRLANSFAVEKETDDRGVYRLYGLGPGTYVVMAGGAANYYSSANIDPFDTDVPTYAPSSSRDTASEINVRSGDELSGIDITYRGEQGRVISGKVTSTSQGFNVMLTAVGDGIVPWSGTSYPDMNGQTFSFVGIADGDYDLYARSYGENREFSISDVKRIRVRGADVTGIELITRPFATVAGRVVLEETNPPECTDKTRPVFEEMTVGAWHNDSETAKEIPVSVWSEGAPVKPDGQGNFLVRNLAPGEYYFAARLTAKNWYVRAVQLASPTSGVKKPIDATRVWTNLKLGDRLSGLTLTLVPGGGSFRGQLVLGEGEKVPERTFVYLAPMERERVENPLSYYGTPVTSEGKIALNSIAPGRYWISVQTVGEDAPLPLSRIRFPDGTETRAQIRRDAEAAKIEIEFKPCQNVVDYKLPLKPAGQ
jgi:Carboxypeptidase regulatory-like domain